MLTLKNHWKKAAAFLAGAYILLFAGVRLAGLRVGFDYDDTLSFSTPAFEKAFASGERPFSEPFWRIVNQNHALERAKKVPVAVALGFKTLGFKVAVITSRKDFSSEALVKRWRGLVNDFYFSSKKAEVLRQNRYVLFFGDSDSDIEEARAAGVPAVRVRRSPESSYKEKYNPGSLGERILPFSE